MINIRNHALQIILTWLLVYLPEQRYNPCIQLQR